MTSPSPASLKSLYLAWVEEQIEDYKESLPRSELLRLADDVVTDLRITRRGQYQLTEVLLCDEVDRKIFDLLDLPGYRSWCSAREHEHGSDGEVCVSL